MAEARPAHVNPSHRPLRWRLLARRQHGRAWRPQWAMLAPRSLSRGLEKPLCQSCGRSQRAYRPAGVWSWNLSHGPVQSSLAQAGLGSLAPNHHPCTVRRQGDAGQYYCLLRDSFPLWSGTENPTPNCIERNAERAEFSHSVPLPVTVQFSWQNGGNETNTHCEDTRYFTLGLHVHI